MTIKIKLCNLPTVISQAAAEELAQSLTADEAGEPDAWQYKAAKFEHGYIVQVFDESGHFIGAL